LVQVDVVAERAALAADGLYSAPELNWLDPK